MISDFRELITGGITKPVKIGNIGTFLRMIRFQGRICEERLTFWEKMKRDADCD